MPPDTHPANDGETVQSMEDLRRENAEYKRFFEMALDMICIAGTDGYFKKLNPAWERTLGFTTEELLARPFVEFIHPDDRADTMAAVEKLAHGTDVVRFENRYRHKDGSYRWLSWKAPAILPGEDHLHASARDITERKSTEAELQDREAQLEAANKELEAFSYSVSHDLRAPLRHVQGYIALLKKALGEQLPENAARHLDVISGASRQMGQLIDDLLAFSRIGRTEMHRSAVNLDEVLQGCLASLDAETRGRNIVWRIAPLPAVTGDPAMLRQVFANLLGNAVKYTGPRDPAEIEIGTCGSEDGRTIFFIRDNGVGFDMQYSGKLFGVFQRLHTSEEFEGTGIGLANVRRIITRHGGRIWPQAELEKGAAFFFTLEQSRTPAQCAAPV